MEENFGLLCTENTDSCFGDFDCNASVDFGFSSFSSWHNQNQSFFNNNNDNVLMDFPVLSEGRVREMVEREIMHLPKQDYLMRLRTGDLDLKIRREAFDWIIKAQTHLSFGAISVCLSMNYLDRFLSVYQLPKGKIWAVQLLAVSCLSLAAKLEEINIPSSVELQVGEPKFMFEAKTIQRMELLVVSTLKWRIQAITPYSYLDYFLIKINNSNQNIPNSLITRSLELISITIKGIDFLEFKPSEIAAAVATFVSTEDKAIPPCFYTHIQKERVEKAIELIRDMPMKKGERVRSGRESPNGVLSYKSDDITVGSCANSASHNSPDIKRRKHTNKKETPLGNNS